MLDRSDFDEPSVFLPENLLREARHKRSIPMGDVPRVCVLDPDGDIVTHLRSHHAAERSASWACYHTDLWEAAIDDVDIGIVGGAVGAPFAVLVAEELFVSGCQLLISITSAGRISSDPPDECLVLIERALRGEGTSNAYLPPAPIIALAPRLRQRVVEHLHNHDISIIGGTSWTTDAPFRETATALRLARSRGADIVEMEAAALYAFSVARDRSVVCFAQVTNGMGGSDRDLERGVANGAEAACALISAIASEMTR